ncbi:hypothetical protein D3C87_2196350 [compost metagenome]
MQETETDPITPKFLRDIESGNAAVGLIDRANHPPSNVGNLHAIQKQAEMFTNAIFIGKASCDFP